MSLTHSQLKNFSEMVLNHEALPVVLERMSIRYWKEFRDAESIETREKVAAKQDNMDAFFKELQTVIYETTEIIEE